MTDTAQLLIAEAQADTLRPLSVGRQLAAARAAARWSVEDVARSLKFSPRQVMALEADDFSQLQGDTFVRGFVRAYARLFKLDTDALLGALNVAVPPATVQIAVPDNMGEAEVQPFSVRHQRLIIVTLVVLVAAVIGAYVVTRGMPEFAWPERTSAPSSEPVAAESTSVPPAASEPAVAPAPTTVPAPVPMGQVVDVAAPVAAPAVSTELAPGERRISLDFADRSWVEIKDASQQVILTGEFPAGVQQTVKGRPPFKLWIGRASGVRVQYGEQKVDLAPYARDDVARLTLE